MAHDGELRLDFKSNGDKIARNEAKKKNCPPLLPSKAEHYSLTCSRPVALPYLCGCVSSILKPYCEEGNTGISSSSDTGSFEQSAQEVVYQESAGPQLASPRDKDLSILFSCAQLVQLRVTDFATKLRLQQLLYLTSHCNQAAEDFFTSISADHMVTVKLVMEKVAPVEDEEVQERRRALACLMFEITGVYVNIRDVDSICDDNPFVESSTMFPFVNNDFLPPFAFGGE